MSAETKPGSMSMLFATTVPAARRTESATRIPVDAPVRPPAMLLTTSVAPFEGMLMPASDAQIVLLT